MRKYPFLLIFLYAFSTYPQAIVGRSSDSVVSELHYFFNGSFYSKEEQLMSEKKIQELLGKIEGSGRTEKNLRNLEYIFDHVMSKIARKYQANPDLPLTLSKGISNCVTSVAVMAMVLDYFGYTYVIEETSNHVFIVVSMDSKRVLLETTDRFQGFIHKEEEVQASLDKYEKNRENSGIKKIADLRRMFHIEDPLENVTFITLRNLAGLLYYDLAIEEMSKNNFARSLNLLEMAQKFHPNDAKISAMIVYNLLTLAKMSPANSDIQSYCREHFPFIYPQVELYFAKK